MEQHKILFLFVVVCVAAAGLFFSMSRARAADMPAVGDKAPDFTLTSQEEKTVSLHDFAGHWVVLYFYPKDFTSGCTIEAHGFQTDIEKYKAKDTVILGVSVDSAGSHKDFCAREGLNFKVLADTEHAVSEKYGSLMAIGLSARNTFIIDPKGMVAKVFPSVKPAQHSAEVLAALDELQKEPLKK